MKIDEVRNNVFYQFPQWLLDEDYKDLSLRAKVMYMLIFDRRALSVQNKWHDKNGDVFVYFTNQQFMVLLNCNEKTVIKAKKELQDFGLIKEERQGVNKPNRLYISGTVKNTGQELQKIQSIKTDNINTEYNHTDIINYEDEKKSLSQIIKSTSVKINDRQIQQIQEYIGLDNMTVEMIDYAIQLTEDAGAESFNYLNKILKSWKDKGLTSLDEAKNETIGFRESKNITPNSRIEGNSVIQMYDDPLPF